MDCKSGFVNKTKPSMYLVRQRLAIGALKLAKSAKIGENEGQKYKIVYFEANFTFKRL